MKTTMRTLALVLLMAVALTSTCITVLAADEIPPASAIGEAPPAAADDEVFANDEEMVNYSVANARNLERAANDGTRLSGSRISNIENAPALRVDSNIVIPQVDLTPDEEAEEPEDTVYSPPPATGAVSFTGLFLCGFALIGCAGLTAKKGKEFAIGE